MGISYNGTVTYHTVTATDPVGAFPITMNAWFYTTGFSNQAVFAIGTPSGATSGDFIGVHTTTVGGGTVRLFYNSSGNTILNCGTSGTTNAWQMGTLVVESGAANYHVYLNGANKTSSTSGNAYPSETGEITVGARVVNGTASNQFGGRIAECAIWNTNLSDAEVQSLFYVDARQIRPSALVTYIPVFPNADGTVGSIDEWLGKLAALAVNATPTVTDHPPIMRSNDFMNWHIPVTPAGATEWGPLLAGKRNSLVITP